MAGRNLPVSIEEAVFFGRRHEAKAVLLIKADGPFGGGPGADQQVAGGLAGQEREQRGADSAALVGGAHVGVTDEGRIKNLLNAMTPVSAPDSSQPQKSTPASISARRADAVIYGSCQRSGGMTPR